MNNDSILYDKHNYSLSLKILKVCTCSFLYSYQLFNYFPISNVYDNLQRLYILLCVSVTQYKKEYKTTFFFPHSYQFNAMEIKLYLLDEYMPYKRTITTQLSYITK